jgi:hypothetical protein
VGVAFAAAGLAVVPVAVADRAAGQAPNPGITSWGAGPDFDSLEDTFPAGVDEVFIDVRGGRGGNGESASVGGLGGRVVGPLHLEPGATISVTTGRNGGHANQHIAGAAGPGAGVGGAGVEVQDGNAGGAGGGAAELRLGADAGPEQRLVVAGGGGGGGGAHQPTSAGHGGAGSGDAVAGDGACGTNPGAGADGASGGAGGIGVNGGANGQAGSTSTGGAGGASTVAQGDGGGGGGAGVVGGGGGGGNALLGTDGGCGGGGSGLAPDGTIAQAGVSTGLLVRTYRCIDDPCTPSFTDVAEEHPFFWEIEILAYDDIAGGYEDGGYHPSASITRQAMAAFLARFANIDEDDVQLPEEPTFSDVSAEHPFAWQIEWMDDAGISTGYEDGTFRPSAAITRQSMAAFLERAAVFEATLAGEAPTFTDVGPNHPFREAIEWMSGTAITTGYEDGTFRPSAPVTRQAMAAFLLRFQPLADW